MFRTALLTTLVVLLLSAAGCTQSESTDAVEEQLAAVTAERDALLDTASQQQERHDRALATLDEVTAMLSDPESVGSEEDVVDAIAGHSTDTAVMDDDVFGPMPYRSGFYNTLYGGVVDARIDAYDWWVSEDGSQGGVSWIWYGTNQAGNPFELPGISLIEFAEDGRIEYELVTYPYTDDYVRNAFTGDGTPTPSTGTDRATDDAEADILSTVEALGVAVNAYDTEAIREYVTVDFTWQSTGPAQALDEYLAYVDAHYENLDFHVEATSDPFVILDGDEYVVVQQEAVNSTGFEAVGTMTSRLVEVDGVWLIREVRWVEGAGGSTE
jgi:hypothetical protein